MSIVLDTSALLALAVDGPQRAVVLDALERDPIWCASAMALTEALPAIDRLTDEPVLRADLEDAIRLDVGSPPCRAARPAVPRRRRERWPGRSPSD